ncbi:MAG: hypothetical protein U0270_40220 [Labilithrix sp.]
MQSFHLRAALDDVIAAVTDYLGGRGFSPVEADADPSARRIAFYADGGWVGLAEEPFAAAEWGPVLSEALGSEVITLEGEGDHAFYTHVFVHADGAERHAARVPDDITLDDDGEHRLRAKFLGEALAVDELGGEGNLELIGARLGVPRPLFHVDDAPARTLYFAYTSDAPGKGTDLVKLMGIELAPGMRAIMGVRAKRTDGPPRLVACQESNSHEVFAREDGHVWASFLLEDAEAAKGLTVSLYGDGLALFDAARIRARAGDQEWTALPAIEDGLVTFSLPNVELAQPAARPDTSHLPLAERLRQGMKRLGVRAIGGNRAEVTLWIEGRFTAHGEGELALTVQLVGHQASAATTDIALKVKPAVRTPLLPPGAPKPHPVYVESYDARDLAYGWVAFDAPWSDVRDVVMAIAQEAERALSEATGSSKLEGVAQLRSGKRRTLKKDVWAKAEAALEAGADVSLSLGKLFEGASIDLVHQVDGPNLLPGSTWPKDAGSVRPPAVWLAWWCPRPDSDAGVRALARFAERALERAAKVPSNVGGLASAQRERSIGHFDIAYDTIANLRDRTNQASWLRRHPRGPGWRVLVPSEGRILKSPAPDPFEYSPSDAEAMERLILPLLA